ncbi:MAG: flagellar basal body P-ring protein FlgI [Spirochaetia bacterium]|nr:flagellar basal body P-ring protein FlgI [Spirochaetia bacterium]
MKRNIILIFVLLHNFSIEPVTVAIKDVVKISSQRENYLLGYGLVVGLPQTGDTKSLLAKESLENILKYSGITTDMDKLVNKNTAAVMVMANMPAVTKSGDKIDVWISSIGDAKSLAGGYLLQTPLMGQDGTVYAIAQVHIEKNFSQNQRSSSDKITTLFEPGGATIEKSVNQPMFLDNGKIRLALKRFDISNLHAVQQSIEKKYPGSVTVTNDAILELTIPENVKPLEFLSTALQQPVEVTGGNKVVIDPQSATIVMGNDVKISTVGVTKNGILLKVQGKSGEKAKTASNGVIEGSTTVEELVKGLNSLGVSAEDIMDIIKSIHAAGALQGELIIL